MTTIQTKQIRVHKSKHVSTVKKELSDEDKVRLQAIDEAKTNRFRKAVQIPALQIQSSIQTPLRSRDLIICEDEPQRVQAERPRKSLYNINKYKKKFLEKLLRISSQIRFGDALIHVRKVNISYLTPITMQLRALIIQEEENDTELIMEEPLMRYNS
ncbi:MAG: hypothetical protein EZS28_027548 [Streblomastix strix]|uniref:Uncharacterized protein n=1 Tax=Streblomastix strix TaxID=222440 RepID=A0A5J4V4E4_9EUKA|nr:MAG: hypothetical protein EZS28_027548 [Streblomastix strix]